MKIFLSGLIFIVSINLLASPFVSDMEFKPFYTIQELPDRPNNRALYIYIKQDRERDLRSELKKIRKFMGKHGRLKHDKRVGEIHIFDNVVNIRNIVAYLEEMGI